MRESKEHLQYPKVFAEKHNDNHGVIPYFAAVCDLIVTLFLGALLYVLTYKFIF